MPTPKPFFAGPKYAVLTGDVVASTQWPNPRSLPRILREVFVALRPDVGPAHRGLYAFEIHRGDAFQGVVEPGRALSVAVFVRAHLRSLQGLGPGLSQRLDARIAIGLGDLEFRGDRIGASTGSAAQLSGRALDRLHRDGKDQRLAVAAVDDDLARDLAPIVSFVDTLVTEWRAPAAEVVSWTLRAGKMRQSELADRLGVTQPAISQRRKVARLDKVLELLQQFEERVARGA